jgi:hypothetical protein
LRTDVELEHLATLDDAMALAWIYEQRLAKGADFAAYTSTARSTTLRTSLASKLLALPALNSLSGTTTSASAQMPRLKRLMDEEMAAKRERGECYKCSEKFTRDYFKVCPMKGIYLIELDEEDYSVEPDADTPQISLHAITGISSVETMKLRVCLGATSVDALVDSGSTHSISVATASRLHLLPIHRPGLQVTVANGDMVPSTDVCKDVRFCIDKEEFVMDFFVWQGVSARHEVMAAHTVTTEDILAALLVEFDDVFSTPTGLPLPRRHNHRIHLLLDTAPMAIRPYRYPQLVKDELECQCKEMLQQGIICPSSSMFSPMLLLKKHDGVDYCALNAKTVRGMFPIPVVDELLDELRGTRFFTKLDLRTGYHQVRMDADDINKTAFRTHHDHFEFLVMPFGLTNVPATFQALMNDVLQDFIHAYVLVFFDDILIFNPSWTNHLQHMPAVLQRFRDHSLAVKRSKCSFSKTTVSYLGHVISSQGVAMDADKVEAVRSWPQPRTVRAVRGFLSLIGYYRKFIRSYGEIAAPLTQLLKREAFRRTQEATTHLMRSRRPSPLPRSFNCRISPGCSWWTATHQVRASVRSCTRATGHWHSSVVPSALMPSSSLTSRS